MDGFNLGEASKVLTKSEYTLYYASAQPDFAKLNERLLKSKLERVEKLLAKLKTQKMTSKRTNKKAGLATDAAQKRKKKLQYLTEAKRNFKSLIKEMKNPEVTKKATSKKTAKKKPNLRLIKEAKAFSDNSKQKTQEQNIKSDAKQSKFLKSGFERKVAHSSARNRRNQGRKDSR